MKLCNVIARHETGRKEGEQEYQNANERKVEGQMQK